MKKKSIAFLSVEGDDTISYINNSFCQYLWKSQGNCTSFMTKHVYITHRFNCSCVHFSHLIIPIESKSVSLPISSPKRKRDTLHLAAVLENEGQYQKGEKQVSRNMKIRTRQRASTIVRMPGKVLNGILSVFTF